MKKISFAKIAKQVLMALVILTVLLINISMAYIMFAPDNLPKPFYLMYQASAQSSEEQSAAGPEESSAVPSTTDTASTEVQVYTQNLPVSPPSAPLEIKAGQGLMVDTGTKIVNLSEPSGRRYIRVNVVLEFAPSNLEFYSMTPEEQEAYLVAFDEEINTILPIINDSLITLLSSKAFSDVYTAEGKETVRQEIMNMLNTRLPQYQVIFVYFTEFVVQ